MSLLRAASNHYSKTSTPPLPQFQTGLRAIIAGWWIAAVGVIAGILLSTVGWKVDGPAIAVLALAPLMLAIDRRLFPGLLIGPISFMYLYQGLGYGLGPLWQIHVIGYLQAIEEGFVPAQWGAVVGLITDCFFQ